MKYCKAACMNDHVAFVANSQKQKGDNFFNFEKLCFQEKYYC